jgi:hypothetical protein
MTELVNQPEGTGTVRKVQWSAWTAATVAPIAAIFAYPFAVLVISLIPFWDTSVGFEAVRLLLEMFITGALTGFSTWAAGYMVKARSGDTGA